MSAPFRRLFSPSLSLDAFAQCACRRAPRAAPFEQARCFSSSPATFSGHSKWATIKHDKAKNDAGKSKQRALLTNDITHAVKLNGPDPNMNPRLALALTTAKKAQIPKATIEAAIARGQGLSTSGAALENVVLETMLPGSVAAVIECQTDNKLRTLADLRLMIKETGGTVSTVGYMFEKKGRIILQKKDGVGADEVLEPAIEAGAEDVQDLDDGRVVLYTDPSDTKTIGETVAKAMGMEIAESEIIYDPNEDTMVPLDDAEVAAKLGEFVDEVQEESGIQGVYLNWAKGSISDELWDELASKTAI
ncbi:YebC-like protein [Bimuria novae-zelandiae CBS 107.79]|uniref:YebC-like protein n=1 Tax=Bimuria novae-zelandiae CBS 107.79 TaxID=1447943 RepID=A0A6A5USJ7_9PLEO|nr:YebC-like protein [Bimuria novae-zelandiae CBS 107.79]